MVYTFNTVSQAALQPESFHCICAYANAGFVLSGYFQGKRNAEHAMAESYPDQGVCLRPGFIHGTRYVSGVGIPLSFIGQTPVSHSASRHSFCA